MLGSIALVEIEVGIGDRGAVELVVHGEARAALADRRAWASAVVRAGKAWATVVIEA